MSKLYDVDDRCASPATYQPSGDSCERSGLPDDVTEFGSMAMIRPNTREATNGAAQALTPRPRGEAASKKHVILFLAANPRGTDRVALDREARAIHEELKRSDYRNRFDLVTRWAAEPLDLLRELRVLKPTVVHMSGHGHGGSIQQAELQRSRDIVVKVSSPRAESQGLYFHEAGGGAQLVPPEAIANAFGAAGASVKLVVLNACFTESVANALVSHVDFVISMNGAMCDDAARSFAIGFYGGLGEYASIAQAFEHGKAAVNLEGFLDADRPQLKVRAGLDARQLILAAVAPMPRLDVPCPYPGMRPYATDDKDTFYGREHEIQELINRLRAGDSEVYVIGPSGSGKTSLVAAGLIPRLASGVSGLGPFAVLTMRPGEQPATRLSKVLDTQRYSPGQSALMTDHAALLAHREPNASLLLVIDQLEELFTLASVEERDAFLIALLTLREERRCAMLVTLRADFFGALMECPLWPRRGGKRLSIVEVSPLRGHELRDAIEMPARGAGVVVEPGLIERLLADAATEPGILPLLQETMLQLWDQRAGQSLTLRDYDALGEGERTGLAVALSRRADTTLRRFNANQVGIARRILLQLISFGEGRPDTRRQQPRGQLGVESEGAADFAFVLQTMIDERLLTVDNAGNEARVDLAHEIMISAWSELAAWTRSYRIDEQRRRKLESAAAAWAHHGRGVRGLLDPFELAEAELWQQTESAIQLGRSASALALIRASRTAQTRQRRRQAVIMGGVAMLCVVAIGASEQRRRAEESDRRNRELVARSYMETGRQLVVNHHFQEALPYLLGARQNGLDCVSLRMMFWEAKQHLPIIVPLEHQGDVWSAAFSPDGTRVVTASGDQTARVWDAMTGKLLVNSLKHQDVVWSAAFSPDGTRVVTASWDNTARVWDATTGRPIAAALEHQARVVSAGFSPDGTRVVTASWDNTARVWDAATGKAMTGPLAHKSIVISARFSPDGARVVTASADNTARIWDSSTGELVTTPLGHLGSVASATFASNGGNVVTASWDGTARVWDAATGKPVTVPLKHQAAVLNAAFSPDGTRVVTTSRDKTARVWDVATGNPVTAPLEHQAEVYSAVFSPDGTSVATASWDRTARVWDATTGNPLTSSLEHLSEVTSVAFSPDSTRVVTASLDKMVRVWDTAMSKPVAGPYKHQVEVMSAAFSPDGTRMVTASKDKSAWVSDAATGNPVSGPLEHQAEIVSAAFSPDGERVVTTSKDNTARVWDAATGSPVSGLFRHQAEVVSAAFSRDGTRVVTASKDNTARVWDAETGNPVTGPLEHQAEVVSAAFSPDGMRVVTASSDKTARIWDAKTGKPATNPLEHQVEAVSAAFSRDGTSIVTASSDEMVRVWDVPPDTGTLYEWSAVVARVPFVLGEHGVLVLRSPQRAQKSSD